MNHQNLSNTPIGICHILYLFTWIWLRTFASSLSSFSMYCSYLLNRDNFRSFNPFWSKCCLIWPFSKLWWWVGGVHMWPRIKVQIMFLAARSCESTHHYYKRGILEKECFAGKVSTSDRSVLINEKHTLICFYQNPYSLTIQTSQQYDLKYSINPTQSHPCNNQMQ